MSQPNAGATTKAVRLFIYTHFTERGFAPDTAAIAGKLGIATDEARAHLSTLAAQRALILGPGGDRIAVAPPFSHVPTPFWVETARGSFWGNCAWEALGVAALLGVDATIHTRSGAEAEPLAIEVRDGAVATRGVVHVPRPRATWWDDIQLTCGTLLAFRSDAEVDRWCERHGFPRGETWTFADAWYMATTWFTGRLDPDWRRLTSEEARATFEHIGCTSEFWAEAHPGPPASS